jgi:hypothetical protein
MAFAEITLVPSQYLVEGIFSTVAIRPADVEIAKLDADTLSTVPTAPPKAGGACEVPGYIWTCSGGCAVVSWAMAPLAAQNATTPPNKVDINLMRNAALLMRYLQKGRRLSYSMRPFWTFRDAQNLPLPDSEKSPQAVKCSLRGSPTAVKWQPMGTHSRPGGRRVNLL